MILRPLVDLPLIVVATLLLLGLVVHGLVWSRRSERRTWLRRTLMVLLLAAIALRPGLGEEPIPTRTADIEVIVALDRTTSMSAQDWDGDRPRFDGVRADLDALVEQLPTGRFTVITFGRRVRTELPSTKDESLITTALALLRREEVYAGTGSRLDRPIETIEQLLAQMEQRNPTRPRVLVLMADGENTDPSPQATFAELAPLLDGAAVLGYGTTEGGLMPFDQDDPTSGWVPDPTTGQPGLSRIDEANLTTVADQLDAAYLHRTGPGGLQPVTTAWTDRFREAEDGFEGPDVPVSLELYWLLALALFAVTLLELRLQWRRFWQARRSR